MAGLLDERGWRALTVIAWEGHASMARVLVRARKEGFAFRNRNEARRAVARLVRLGLVVLDSELHEYTLDEKVASEYAEGARRIVGLCTDRIRLVRIGLEG